MNNNLDNQKDLTEAQNAEVEKELFDIENIESEGSEIEVEIPKIKFKDKIEEFKVVKALKGKVWPILLPFMVVMGFLVVLPLLGIIIFSIVEPTSNSIKFEFDFTNFVKLITSGSIILVLGLSILYAFVASVVTVIMAYPIALIMANLKSKFLAKNIWVLVTLPIWISMILKILGLQSLFLLISPSALGTPIAIIIGMVYMFIPFAISPIYNALENQDPSYYNAALDLKASKTKAFWHTTFRQSLPGVFAGFTLVLIQAATSLLIVRYMGDGKINLITTIIENYFFKGTDFSFGATVAVVLAILLFILMGVMKLISNKFEVRGSKKWKNSSNQVIS
ncbi:spermidine/putrescine ABC transporter permease [Spiroplasma taiwanense]|uniref:Spermidine/putrescine ABC transporter permease n=1 Tax=Spiroplasma taiwanense CT-1 TaxID=1276220 RepID=S5LYT6_9MOLU|nr:spermidine/putrescine ABC transporter permease [Spiroplasma taiwanense]AGR40847.1 spermidine/putrescine ABC transporter permease [Spiroplasma taiwanense CT-1]